MSIKFCRIKCTSDVSVIFIVNSKAVFSGYDMLGLFDKLEILMSTSKFVVETDVHTPLLSDMPIHSIKSKIGLQI